MISICIIMLKLCRERFTKVMNILMVVCSLVTSQECFYVGEKKSENLQNAL